MQLVADKRLLEIEKECHLSRPRYHSQGKEDIILMHHYFCSNRKKGRYVEIGALDGLLMTNTKFFEDTLGWTGALIEGNPANSAKLKRNRPRSKVFEMAVCPEGVGQLKFIGNAGGVGGAVDTMAKSHREGWNRGAREYKVPCQPFTWILGEAGLSHVDIFSLDVEGAELAVLETMDWDVPVCIWVIELDGKDKQKDQGVRDLLTSKGYRKASWDINLLCQALQPRKKTNCMLGNEVFEYSALDTCGIRGQA